MSDPVSPNMGLTLPQPGTTTGGSPNYTYATEITADLSLIDTHNHTSGQGVRVPTAGLNINADLAMGGFSLTGANNITATGAVTLSGSGTALSITNNATVSGTLTVGTLSLGTLTLTGAGTALTVNNNALISGTLTVSSTATVGSTLSVVGAILETTASTALTLKGNAAATSGIGTILDNATTQTSGSVVSFRTGGTEQANIDFAGNLNLTNGGSILQLKATTSLTLKGHVAATSAIAVLLDNIVAQTSGTILSIRSGNTEQANVDWTGNLNLTGGGSILQTKASTSLTLQGNAAATGVGVILNNAVTMTGAGKTLSVRNNGTEVFYLDINGILNIAGTIQQVSTATQFDLTSIYSAGSGAFLFNASNQASGTGVHTNFQTAGATKLQILNNGDVVSPNHIRTNGGQPTVTTAVGAASAAVVGTDQAGILTLTTTSSTPTINQALFTVTLSTAFQASGKYSVAIYPATNGAATLGLNPYVTSVTVGSWVLAAGTSVAMGTGTTSWYYTILGAN
jgi:hypothetical protein